LIHGCGDAMNRTDKGSATAANHAVTNFSAHKKVSVKCFKVEVELLL
jgi:hypothetical protein